jgi:hypothetical protein
MAITVKHKFASAKSDGADSTLIQPSNWNETHDFLMATARVLGRTTSGDGPVEELTAGAGLQFASGQIRFSATASVDIGAVPLARLVSTGVGLTGGGALSADLTIAADIASKAEAEAGTNNTKLMTPLRVREALNAGYRPVDGAIQFTSSGTYTPSSPEVRAIRVEVLGGGGGGGRAGVTGSGETGYAGGGGGGGYATKFITLPSPHGGYTGTITVGAAGSGGASPTGGGDSIYSDGTSTVTGSGGAVGSSGTASSNSGAGNNGGNGGSFSGGDYGRPGSPGAPGANTGNQTRGRGGAGGSSMFGAGGRSSVVNGNTGSAVGVNASGRGGGGAGGANGASNSATNGGNGTAGIVIVTEYF